MLEFRVSEAIIGKNDGKRIHAGIFRLVKPLSAGCVGFWAEKFFRRNEPAELNDMHGLPVELRGPRLRS